MTEHRQVATGDAPPPTGAYSQAVIIDGWCYVSGQVGWDAAGRGLEHGVTEQTRQAIANVAVILAAAGGSWLDVVRTTVYLRDLADMTAFNDAYARALDEFGVAVLPARTTVGATIWPAVEIDVVAKLRETGT